MLFGCIFYVPNVQPSFSPGGHRGCTGMEFLPHEVNGCISTIIRIHQWLYNKGDIFCS